MKSLFYRYDNSVEHHRHLDFLLHVICGHKLVVPQHRSHVLQLDLLVAPCGPHTAASSAAAATTDT